MPTVAEMLTVNENNVRKWGTQLFFLCAPDAEVPDEFFGTEDRLPILPLGAIQLGFITTDGITMDETISSEKTNMLQSLEAVRTDITGKEATLTVTFGEDNAFVQALVHGVPFEDFPESADGPWLFDDGEVTDLPYYRLGWIGQDGVGSQARYRVEYAYRAKLSAKTGRTANRADAETYGVTFDLLKDPVTGLVLTRAQNGPAYASGGEGEGEGEGSGEGEG